MSSPNTPSDRYAPPAPRREATTVSEDGATLHVEEHGPADGPAVVLAHGWTCSTDFWAPVVRALTADGHRVVVYDQRGHGRSPAADPSQYSTGKLADDLCAVLDTVLGPGERAVIGGHSMGAMTLMAAAERPRLRECAAALLLCSTGPAQLVRESTVLPLPRGRVRTWLTARVLGTRAPLGPVTPVSRRILKYATMGRPSTPRQVETCARIVHACPRGVRAGWAHVLDELDLESGLARLTPPTAVVAGTADRLTPLVHARRMVEALPHCTGLTELRGRGHMTPVEEPETVTGVLADLVREHLVADTAPGRAVPGQRAAADQEAKEESA
ncbi:alpha/beta fold hydrolase [Streptomyces sp. TR06-5]|uniref:alpha/beta fold hydrolase n=1 Tax=Streptomyces sp. TR06-5 TaxID=3385976 RepID=UPI0039A2B6DE